MTPTPEEGPGVFAQRLDHLIKTVRPKDREPYSLQELADQLNEAAGDKLFTKGYLSQLRHGDRGLPSYPRLKALSQVFGVPLAYFDDDDIAEQVDQQLEALVTMRENGVINMAFRAAGLSAESLQTIMAVIEQARKAEGLNESGKPDA